MAYRLPCADNDRDSGSKDGGDDYELHAFTHGACLPSKSGTTRPNWVPHLTHKMRAARGSRSHMRCAAMVVRAATQAQFALVRVFLKRLYRRLTVHRRNRASACGKKDALASIGANFFVLSDRCRRRQISVGLAAVCVPSTGWAPMPRIGAFSF